MSKHNSKNKNGLRPSWADRVVILRARLRLGQGDFGARLGVSFMTVSRWERGVREPSASDYIHLGTLAGPPDCWYYWSLAGLSRQTVAQALGDAKHEIWLEHVPDCPSKDGLLGNTGCICVVVNRQEFERLISTQGVKVIQQALNRAAQELLGRQLTSGE